MDNIKAGFHIVGDFVGCFGEVGKFARDIIKAVGDRVASISEDDQKYEITIVFDDLERVSKSIQYRDLFGFFDQLAENFGCKIICIASESNISDQDRKNSQNLKRRLFSAFVI